LQVYCSFPSSLPFRCSKMSTIPALSAITVKAPSDTLSKPACSPATQLDLAAMGEKARIFLKSLLYLVLILTYSLFLSVFAIFCSFYYGPKRKPSSSSIAAKTSKNILITTAKMSKSLHLIRNLKWKYPEHKIYCTDSNYLFASKFSNCVEKSFTLIYADSQNEAVLNEFIQSLIAIITKYRIDVIVPGCSIEEAKCLSILKRKLVDLDVECEILIEDEEILNQLDDKDKFFSLFNHSKIVRDDEFAENQLAQMEVDSVMASYYGKDTQSKVAFPFSITFEHKNRLMAFIKGNGLLVDHEVDSKDYKFILKRIVLSNNRDEHIIKLPTNKKRLLENIVVNESEPWILQQFIKGTDVVACIYCKDGDVKMYNDSMCCDMCVNYYPMNNEHIKAWLVAKCREFKLSGLICFDFIKSDDGRCYVLECNPRPHSSTVLMNDPQWVSKIIESESNDGGSAAAKADLVKADGTTAGMYDVTGSSKQHVFWLYHELLRMVGVLDMFPLSYRYDRERIMEDVYDEGKPPVFVDEFGYLRVNIRGVLVGRDAVLNVHDPWPVVVSHGVHMPLLIIKQILGGCKGWSVFDLCIVKLVGNDL